MKKGVTTPERRTRAKSEPATFRITDYPMHYFAAIQRQNQINLAHALRSLGISPQFWRVLGTLSDGEGRTIGYIADAAVIDRSNLGRILENMATEGLIDRTTAADDRRISLTKLTRKGMARYEAAVPIVLGMYNRLFEDIDPQDFDNLMKTLRTLKRNALNLAER
jgi:MarR family transcriptional regulator, organic hydroperoxide resistance regulator